jgi:hypothetical protein
LGAWHKSTAVFLNKQLPRLSFRPTEIGVGQSVAIHIGHCERRALPGIKPRHEGLFFEVIVFVFKVLKRDCTGYFFENSGRRAGGKNPAPTGIFYFQG